MALMRQFDEKELAGLAFMFLSGVLLNEGKNVLHICPFLTPEALQEISKRAGQSGDDLSFEDTLRILYSQIFKGE